MNDKFFSLPIEKQQTIINAGYKVFSQNTYKKSPMSEIADAAGISKALLFYYFQNKKELYLFLWNTCAKLTSEYLVKYSCYETKDFFEMMERGLQAKVQLMKEYPYMTAFSLKAFYEKDPAVCDDIQNNYQERVNSQYDKITQMFSTDVFVPGLDIQQMYQQMCWAAEGYLWEKVNQGQFDPNEVEQDFHRMMGFWKSVYLRK